MSHQVKKFLRIKLVVNLLLTKYLIPITATLSEKPLRLKKVALFPEIGRIKIFYHSPTRIVECVSEYIFLISKKTNKQTRRQKANETKDKKRISVENLTGHADIVCEFVLCTFNLFDRVVNFSWLFI